MGCASSRLDDLPAVALCRDSRNFLSDALRHRRALADAHLAYTQSLSRVGPSLRLFFETYYQPNNNPTPPASPARSAAHDSRLHLESSSDSESSSPPHSDANGIRLETLTNDCNYSISQATRSVSATAAAAYHYYGGGSIPKSPPPPPAPAGNSGWDFLSLFEEYERYGPPYIYENPNRDSEEATGGESQFRGRNGHNCEALEEIKKDEDQGRERNEETDQENEESKCEDAKRDVEIDREEFKISEVMREIEKLLEKASESGNEVSKMLQSNSGRIHFHEKNNAVSQVSSKMWSAITPSVSVPSSQHSPANNLDSGTLSSVMEKLYMWEKKLHDEVKAEEKLRTIHEKKCRQLKCMDEKGADANKINSVKNVIMSLSIRIKISIQVVDRISVTITKLRDEELWPQITTLIHGLRRMWRNMLEAQRRLSKEVAEAKALDCIASNAVNDSHLEAIIQLKLQLQNWNLSFSSWVDSEKGFVKALNNWLLRCLFQEPEHIVDGLSTTPSMIGAPPMFVLCNQWAQAVDRLSEKEVIDAIQGFSNNLGQILEQHREIFHQRMMVDKDLEKKVKALEREDRKMQKLMQARDKHMIAQAFHQSSSGFSNSSRGEVSNKIGLHLGLKLIFEATESFIEKSMQAYDELCVRLDEDVQASDIPKVL